MCKPIAEEMVGPTEGQGFQSVDYRKPLKFSDRANFLNKDL